MSWSTAWWESVWEPRRELLPAETCLSLTAVNIHHCSLRNVSKPKSDPITLSFKIPSSSPNCSQDKTPNPYPVLPGVAWSDPDLPLQPPLPMPGPTAVCSPCHISLTPGLVGRILQILQISTQTLFLHTWSGSILFVLIAPATADNCAFLCMGTGHVPVCVPSIPLQTTLLRLPCTGGTLLQAVIWRSCISSLLPTPANHSHPAPPIPFLVLPTPPGFVPRALGWSDSFC